ncbi:MAG: electron transport complex subunit E [Eubacteriaceae bacterium]|jgi:electron transport complex protein RnfE|nr:electron transport complex subunit E [Eubacteriaceae bacterium]
MGVFRHLKNGILSENPTFRLVIGMCPTLAVTTSAVNGLGMGLSTMAVLVGSNVALSAMRKIVPDQIRIPIFVVVIASFVTIVSMLLEAFVPSLFEALGIYIPLIVVNCIIIQRAEAFANQNSVLNSMADGIGMGLGFTLSLTVLGIIREILGAGSVFGISLLGASYEPAMIFIQPPGAFLTLGVLMGLVNFIEYKRKEKKIQAGEKQ